MKGRQKKYYYNDDFFENIDSEVKAYYLGFLYADSYINDKENYVDLTLHKDDEYILTMFYKHLESNRKFIRIRNDRHSRLVICSKKIVNDLIKLGCTSRKSFTLKFPENIDYKYIPHMIRGYFDGNGCIWNKKNAYEYRLQFTGCIYFLSGVEKYFLENLDIDKKDHYCNCNKNRCENVKTLKYGGNQIVTKIFNLLYKDATIYLIRKHDKFLIARDNIKEKDHIVIYNGITYDSYNKTKLIDIIQSKTSFNRDIISVRLIKGWSVNEIIQSDIKKILS
jgi:hypothetical protein